MQRRGERDCVDQGAQCGFYSVLACASLLTAQGAPIVPPCLEVRTQRNREVEEGHTAPCESRLDLHPGRLTPKGNSPDVL